MKRSKAWQYFKEVTVDGVKYRQCILCNDKLRKFENTSNMLSHVKAKHSVQTPTNSKQISRCAAVTSANRISVPSVQGTLSFAEMKSCNKDRQKHVTELILNVVIEDMRPVSILNGRAFKALMLNSEPRYRMVSR